MIKKIERPDWKNLPLNLKPGSMQWSANAASIDKWFDEHIKPINEALDEAVVVYGNKVHPLKPIAIWSQGFTGTHKGLLVNIKPIKQESAADVLKDILTDWIYKTELIKGHNDNELLKRAKAVLGEGEL